MSVPGAARYVQATGRTFVTGATVIPCSLSALAGPAPSCGAADARCAALVKVPAARDPGCAATGGLVTHAGMGDAR